MLTFRDTDGNFELRRDLLKFVTNKKYNDDLANLSDKKMLFEFAKEMCFDGKALSIESSGNRSPI